MFLATSSCIFNEPSLVDRRLSTSWNMYPENSCLRMWHTLLWHWLWRASPTYTSHEWVSCHCLRSRGAQRLHTTPGGHAVEDNEMPFYHPTTHNHSTFPTISGHSTGGSLRETTHWVDIADSLPILDSLHFGCEQLSPMLLYSHRYSRNHSWADEVCVSAEPEQVNVPPCLLSRLDLLRRPVAMDPRTTYRKMVKLRAFCWAMS